MKKNIEKTAAPMQTAKFTKLSLAALISVFVCAATLYAGDKAYSADQGSEAASAVKYPNPHDINNKQTCVVCHESDNKKLRQDPVSTCLRCHEGNKDGHPVARHPIGRESKIIFPSALPTAPGGKMVCYTCHEPHNKSGNKRLLRIEFDKLCASCHPGY